MNRLAFALALAIILALPASSRGAGCSPLNCGPSQLPLAGGTLLAVRARGVDGNIRVLSLRTGTTRWWLPAGILGGDLLVHEDGTLLTWFDAATGGRVASAVADLRGAFALVGSSQDGRQAVLARTERRRTTFVILSPHKQKQVVLGGNTWSFDALAGERLYLIHSLRRGYQVRLYDLARNRLEPQPLKDPGESALIEGVPWQRVSSSDGRYLLTLYLSSKGGAMVHELDLVGGTARCIDLPGTGNFSAASSYALVLSPDGRTLWAVSPGYGRVVSVDLHAHRVLVRFAFTPGPSTGNPGLGAAAADGTRLAVTDSQHIWLLDLTRQRVLRTEPHVAIALGFAPDGKKIWTIGERSRVSSIQLPAQ
jgi:hypothetical protein